MTNGQSNHNQQSFLFEPVSDFLPKPGCHSQGHANGFTFLIVPATERARFYVSVITLSGDGYDIEGVIKPIRKERIFAALTRFTDVSLIEWRQVSGGKWSRNYYLEPA
ncbi:MAG: hypothetical protein OEZ68_22135 [Gammaproteobacteria bacterium]|nr:hypothetical protein [Gammaproteobacteria bacterium]MDH5803487.1 hypothetical protein [Gammaproteobacteria bacterium]